MSTRITSRECDDVEVRELRNQLISQKWLLSNLVKLREQEVIDECKKIKNDLKRYVNRETSSKSFLETLLHNKETRITSKSPETSDVLRRGLCCFAINEKLCSKPSLPFTRHCREHILYNEQQRLFERCTAKCSQTLNQCPNATFDIEREEPLCDLHKKLREEKLQSVDATDGQIVATGRAVECILPIAQKGRKKPKLTTASKTQRTTAKKKRRANSGGKLLNCSLDSSSTSFLSSHDSSEKSFASDSCDAGKVELSSVKFNLINTSSLPSAPNTTFTSTSGIPSSLKSRSASDCGVYSSLPIIPMSSAAFTTPPVNASTERRTNNSRIDIPPSLDVGVPIAPGDEALVASLVADLPTLGSAPEVGIDPGQGFDTDLIPDDAFNDLFMDNLKNGDIPSKEEAEALEQALAAVSKDVNNLVYAAAAVSGANPTNTFNDSSFYSHPVNGQSHQFHSRPGATTPLNMTETDILGLASNILGSLTTEQQQQLNGLIDGALASGTLTSSPTLKSALASLTNDTMAPLTPPVNNVTSVTQLHQNTMYNTPSISRTVVTSPTSTTMHNITLPSPPPYAAQYNPPSAAVYTHELSQSQLSSQTSVGGLLLTSHDDYINQATFPSNTNLVNRKLTNPSLPSLLQMNTTQTPLPVLRTLAPTPVSLPVVKAGLESKMS
ncbi:INO80 complex subunit D-like protein [Leptotrombidium deliense]|uniref:INO80 complex subunit D-like protein n=1 Tax=Leptotrombidium deliense TaxID=299467 RepID=A0A443SQS0_9ACAR|nr:INO80 complex subunit D-like protein [Leptotrombidium deliense]